MCCCLHAYPPKCLHLSLEPMTRQPDSEYRGASSCPFPKLHYSVRICSSFRGKHESYLHLAGRSDHPRGRYRSPIRSTESLPRPLKGQKNGLRNWSLPNVLGWRHANNTYQGPFDSCLLNAHLSDHLASKGSKSNGIDVRYPLLRFARSVTATTDLP